MQRYGLIGFPLSHSFSKQFFTEHFGNHVDLTYELMELESITLLPTLLSKYPDLCGFNVTAPYKETILPFLDALDDEAKEVTAVNTVKIITTPSSLPQLIGYNTDIYGFEMLLNQSLESASDIKRKALVLGTGGASKAICHVLRKKGIEYLKVSRDPNKGDITYTELSNNILYNYPIIINATPLGTYPNIESYPMLPYEGLGENHLLIDLVYNPVETTFLRMGRERGTRTFNGQFMLEQQALKAYEIWGIF